MKISELQEYLKDYPRTTVSGSSLGCNEEIIRTSTIDRGIKNEVVCEPKDIVETHFKQIKDFIDAHGDFISIYVRIKPDLKQSLDDEGEFSGYVMSTRLQYGVKGRCITQEQYEHLNTFVSNRSEVGLG